MKDRLLKLNDKDIVQASDVLLPEKWPNEVEKTITFEETKIRTLTNKFHLNERNIIRAFRDYLVDKNVPKNLTPPVNTVHTVAVSTSECEREFLQMNLIRTPQRVSLLVKTSFIAKDYQVQWSTNKYLWPFEICGFMVTLKNIILPQTKTVKLVSANRFTMKIWLKFGDFFEIYVPTLG